MHITIHIAQALYETFENWITAQISTAGIFFSHQELLFDWMFLDFTQKWKNLINSIQNIVSKVLLEFNEKEMHLNYISGNFESKCNFQSITKTVIPQFLKNIFIFKR